jgi:hypothetical protein
VSIRHSVSRGAGLLAIVAALGLAGCGDNPEANSAIGNGVRSVGNQLKRNGGRIAGGVGAGGSAGATGCAVTNTCP